MFALHNFNAIGEDYYIDMWHGPCVRLDCPNSDRMLSQHKVWDECMFVQIFIFSVDFGNA